jgi:hypothetical protein
MVLEGEATPPIFRPTEEQVVAIVMGLRKPGPTFAALTTAGGDNVQVAGGRPWCMAEWRQGTPLMHSRPFTESGRRPYIEGALLEFSAGPIRLKADEWLLQKQAVEIFLAFLRQEPFPSFVRWRSINRLLGIEDTTA